jgi:hypothetical protein
VPKSFFTKKMLKDFAKLKKSSTFAAEMNGGAGSRFPRIYTKQMHTDTTAVVCAKQQSNNK